MSAKGAGVNDSWVIEVRWGFGAKWSPLKMESLATQEQAERMIENMRDMARMPNCHPAFTAYADLPMRSARNQVEL
jgi:hypothetical protein